MNTMILLTGATGRLGRVVLEKLVKGKQKLRALVRSRESSRKLPRSVDICIGDITDVKSLREAMNGVDCVIHCAGSVNFADEEEMMRVNWEGTRNILQAAAEAGVRRFIHCSSITVYGKGIDGQEVNEETPACPDSAYAKSKWKAEEECRKFAGKMKVVILRLGVIYGEGFEKGYLEVMKKIKEGKMKVIGKGDNVIPLVHAEDAADAIVKALEKGGGKGSGEKEGAGRREGGSEGTGRSISTYNIVGERKTQKELYGICARELGVNPPSGSVPVFLTKLMARLSGKREREEYLDVLSSDRRFSSKKAEKELKWKAKIGLGKGIKEFVKSHDF